MRGAGNKQLVIRAIGPTLAGFGLEGTLSDTRLELIRGGSSAAMLSNDNWGGTTALSGAFNEVGAFPLTAASREAAI